MTEETSEGEGEGEFGNETEGLLDPRLTPRERDDGFLPNLNRLSLP